MRYERRWYQGNRSKYSSTYSLLYLRFICEPRYYDNKTSNFTIEILSTTSNVVRTIASAQWRGKKAEFVTPRNLTSLFNYWQRETEKIFQFFYT